MREDPSFKVRQDTDSGQTLVCGQGELHLEVIIDRLDREFRQKPHVGKPQVAYRETIGKALRKELEYDREIGGKRQYAKVVLSIEPAERGAGNRYEMGLEQSPDGNFAINKVMMAAVEEGVSDSFTRGALLGYPVEDVIVTLVQARAEEDVSTESAFRAAASMAMAQGLEEGNPRLLEPIMAVEVITPEDFTGNVVSDLQGRRGRVMGMEPAPGGAGSPGGGAQIVRAEVPLSEMVGYATGLRSATQGRASYTMRLSHNQEVSRDLQETIVKRIRGY
jgi:elongation factor G